MIRAMISPIMKADHLLGFSCPRTGCCFTEFDVDAPSRRLVVTKLGGILGVVDDN